MNDNDSNDFVCLIVPDVTFVVSCILFWLRKMSAPAIGAVQNVAAASDRCQPLTMPSWHQEPVDVHGIRNLLMLKHNQQAAWSSMMYKDRCQKHT